MKKSKYRLIFNRRNQLNKHGEGLITLEIYFDRDIRRFINTGIYVKPEHWDKKDKQINVYHSNSLDLNTYIRSLIDRIEAYEIHLLKANKKFTPESLDNLLLQEDNNIPFADYCTRVVERDRDLAHETRRRYKNTIKHLKDFKPGASFDDITYTFINDFNNYLIGLKQHTNTIAKHHAGIRKFINMAIREDLFDISNNPYIKYRIKKQNTVREWLSFKELEKIEAVNYDNNPAFARLKDFFLFCCYTGLRFSDAINLRRNQIIETDNGLAIDLKRMQKVDKSVYLPLGILFDGKPQTIIKKYMVEDNFVLFPDITNQYVNREIKHIGKHAGIKKHLTCHVARHTFGTLLAQIKPDPYLIKELMGHSKIATSMIYIHSSRDNIDKKLKDIDWS